MTKGIHRVAAGTKRARQLQAETSTKNYTNTSEEIKRWNEKVEEAKENKRASKFK